MSNRLNITLAGLLLSLSLSSANALDINFENCPVGEPCSGSIINTNFNQIKNFALPAQPSAEKLAAMIQPNLDYASLEKSIEPHLPKPTQRPSVLSVEPVSAATDDANALKNGAVLLSALATAKAAKNSMTVVVDAGTYRFTTLDVPSNVTLLGLSPTSTILEGTVNIEGMAVSNITVAGGISLNSASPSLQNVIVNAKGQAGIVVGDVATAQLNNVQVTSDVADLLTNSSTPTQISVLNSRLLGVTPTKFNSNTKVTFTNVTFGSTPTFFGDYTNSAQRCLNTLDGNGNPVPNTANPNSTHLCVKPAVPTLSLKKEGVNQLSSDCHQNRDGNTSCSGKAEVALFVTGGTPPYTVTTVAIDDDAPQLLNQTYDENHVPVFFNWSSPDKQYSATINIVDATGKKSLIKIPAS